MLTAKPHLVVRRPSPTTAEFTITTYPSNPTLPVRLLFLLVLPPLRLAAGLFALLLLWSGFQLSPHRAALFPPTVVLDPSPPFPTVAVAATATATTANWPSSFTDADTNGPYIPHTLLHSLSTSHPARLANRLSDALPFTLVLPLAFAILWLALRRLHAAESLLVLRGLGIQTSADPSCYLLARRHTRFIPTEKIRDVLVNEAFRGFEVRHYLVVVVEGEDDVVVVFPGLLPRRRVVETVWRGVRRCLFDGEETTVGGMEKDKG